MAEIRQNVYTQYQQPFGTYSVPSKGLESNNRLVSAVTDTVTPANNNSSFLSSFIISLLASIGIVQGTNFLLQPGKKNITAGMTQYDTYTNSRLYKMGEAIDKCTPVQWVSRKANSAKRALSRIPVPNFIKEIGEKWKIGSVSTWDKTGMWTQGKKVEAMNEFLNFLSESSLNKLNLPNNELQLVKDTLKQFKAGKINPSEAFKRISPKISKVSAKLLEAASPKTGFFGKIFRTPKNLNLSLAKAQTLAKEAGGVVGKPMGKITTMLGEASGGGVLGGPFALLFNAFFIAQNLNEARKAEDGEKLKTFMDEFFGTTLGSYLMQMYMGEKFNKFLNSAEHGMSLTSPEIKKVIETLKIENPERVLDVVNNYNKFVKKNNVLQKVLDEISKNKISVKKASKILSKNGVEVGMREKALAKILTCIEDGKVAQNGTVLLKGAKRAKGVITPDRAIKILRRYGITLPDNSIEAIKNATGQNLKTTITNILQREIKSPDEVKKMYNAIKAETSFKSIFKFKPGTSFLGKVARAVTHWPLAAATRILSIGKYTLTKPDAGFFRKIGGTFKRVGGGIGRMIFVMTVLVPPVANLFTKFSHKVFGKPKKKILEEQQEKAQREQQNQPQIQPQHLPGTAPAGEYVPFSNQNKNLVEMYTNKPYKPQQSAVQPQQTLNNQQSVNNNKNDDNYDKATYIPNQMLTQESYVDTNITDDLLNRRDLALKYADSAEKNARELLDRL